jgi:hypothetical protein
MGWVIRKNLIRCIHTAVGDGQIPTSNPVLAAVGGDSLVIAIDLLPGGFPGITGTMIRVYPG